MVEIMSESISLSRDQFNTLLERSDQKREALIKAREKLQLYRANCSGEYVGGMEYTALIKIMDEAIWGKSP